MAASDISTLFLKKFYGILLLTIGLVLVAVGLGTHHLYFSIAGFLLLGIGLSFLIMKIIRRNQGKSA